MNNSTISSNAFTFASSTDGAIFSGANTLNGVTLDAASNSITNNGTLTVAGTSKLSIGILYGSGTIKLNNATIKDSSILFGSGTMLVDAGKSATFSATGTNTNSLANTTIENSGTITVNDTMTGGAINNIAAEATLIVAGALNCGAVANSGVTASENVGGIAVTGTMNCAMIDNTGRIAVNTGSLSATGAIDNDGTILVYGSLSADTIDNAGGSLYIYYNMSGATAVTASSITGSGTITVDAAGFSSGTRKVIDVTTGTGLDVNSITLVNAGAGVHLAQCVDGDVYLATQDQNQMTIYVKSNYTESSCDGHIYGYNAFSSLNDAARVAAQNGTVLDVENGTYTEITELRGAKTSVQDGTGTTEFTKAVYGGTKVDASDSVTRNTDVSIETGTFDKFFVGGNNIAMPDAETPYTVDGELQSVEISGGEFSAVVAAGDRVQKGRFRLNSDLEMSISGGQYDYIVAGGLLNSLYENTGEEERTNGKADIYGNVSLNISGGAFANDCWIFGGCISTNRELSSYDATIYGDVTVTVDCGAGNTIQLSHLVAGSHGFGQILKDPGSNSGGNTAIVFKGIGTNLSFTGDGELWGGSGRDSLSRITGECSESFVAGDRLLSFEGFTGSLNCKIRDFKSIRLVDESAVGLMAETVTVDLKGIKNWTFEYDSSLTGDFANDFFGDTLNLTGLDAVSLDDWTILTNVSETAFKGFDSFSAVSFGTGEGSAASYSSGSDVWYNSAYVMYRSGNSMLLTTNDSYVTRFGTIA
jgi:hypothetical protein